MEACCSNQPIGQRDGDQPTIPVENSDTAASNCCPSTEKPGVVDFKELCYQLRECTKKTAAKVIEVKASHPALRAPANACADVGEMNANITLAYRHLEDAAMRLGKAIQAYDGGTSCYPR